MSSVRKVFETKTIILNQFKKITPGAFTDSAPKKSPLIVIDDLLQLLDLLDRGLISSSYFHSVVDNCIGLHNAQIPFNCHPDLMKKFIAECFEKTETGSALAANSIQTIDFCPAIKIAVESAHDLPPMDANNSCDPYFKVFSPEIPSRLVFVSSHVENDRNPTWNARLTVPVAWQVQGK